MGTAQMAKRLIRKEFKRLMIDPVDDVQVTLKDDNIRKWEVIFSIPSDSKSLYAGGIFYVHIDFANMYPLRMPKIQMKTKIIHYNIARKGLICTPTYHYDEWGNGSKKGVRDLIMEVRELFDEPLHEAYFYEEVWMLYCTNKKLYEKYARLCTKKFAKINNNDIDDDDSININVGKGVVNIVDYFDNLHVEWNQLRLFWIGFYKNTDNDKCFIAKLPKDIVDKILKLVAKFVTY